MRLCELNTDYIDVVTFLLCGSAKANGAISRLKTVAYEAMVSRPASRGRCDFSVLPATSGIWRARIAVGRSPAPLKQVESPSSGYAYASVQCRPSRGRGRMCFPLTDPRNIPVVVYTCLRWGAFDEAYAG